MTKISILPVVLCLLFFASCGSKKKARSQRKQKTVQVKRSSKSALPKTRVKTVDYIKKYAPYAIAEMRKYHIPASITLAQGILESDSGNSSLTRNSNNHFGIKCHKFWRGKRIYYDDDKKSECFRVYEDPANSFRDHSLFLVEKSRYAKLFKLNKSDYKAWAKELRRAGYATDKKYPQKLIQLIEEYKLFQYDYVVLGKPRKQKKNPPSIHIVKEGETLLTISNKYNTSVDVLLKINNLESNVVFTGQKLIVHPSKGKKIEKVSKETIIVQKSQPKTYTVQKGDTLYSIAQKNNLSVEELRTLNQLKDNIISIGQVLVIIP